MLAGAAALPALASTNAGDDPFPLPKFDYSKLPEPFRPAVVNYKTRQCPGTVIVETGARQLYLVLEGGKALRFGGPSRVAPMLTHPRNATPPATATCRKSEWIDSKAPR